MRRQTRRWEQGMQLLAKIVKTFRTHQERTCSSISKNHRTGVVSSSGEVLDIKPGQSRDRLIVAVCASISVLM